jgi:hypothetical protein
MWPARPGKRQAFGAAADPGTGVGRAEALHERLVLNTGEAQRAALPQEQRPGLRVGEVPRLGHDPLEQHPEVPLARQGDADLDELPEQLVQASRLSRDV